MKWSITAALLIASPALPAAAQPAPFAAAASAPVIGTSWYPEQWPEDRWDADLALMEKAHLSVVRIGEFAWSRLEPRDSVFEFGWLDRAIAAAAKHKLRVVLGTPTAAPPSWLTRAHPDTLRVDEDGRTDGHGARRHYSVASTTYRRYATRVAAELAKRYGRHPAVIGWQIDNEIGLPSYDAEARSRWTGWLRSRYGSVAMLNQRWATSYWSQHYDGFAEVSLRLNGPYNPALKLDGRRFQSDLWAGYIADQVRAIRMACEPRQFITSNFTAWNDNFDQYAVQRDLDLASWDDYVPEGRPDWMANALHHDLVRGFKSRNFWVMEAQPGSVDWSPVNRSLDPGQTRELAWQAVMHGADAILYWQWRSAPGGQEQYHGTMVGADGSPMPVFDEIARTGEEMAKLRNALAGTSPMPAQVALIYSQEGRWAIEQERHSRDYDPVTVMKDWYRPIGAAVPVDVISSEVDLKRYRAVFAPQLNVLDATTAKRLVEYVRDGGTLLLGPRSGMKNPDNALWQQRQPGPLTEALGATVENFYALDTDVPLGGTPGLARIWAERLKTTGTASVVLRYGAGNAWLTGMPAMVERRLGRGTIAYLGALLDSAGQAAVTQWVLKRGNVLVPQAITTGSDVEVGRRCRSDGCVAIVINHGEQTAALTYGRDIRMLAGDAVGRTLPPHGVVVLADGAPGK